jgi:hypothetical protein
MTDAALAFMVRAAMILEEATAKIDNAVSTYPAYVGASHLLRREPFKLRFAGHFSTLTVTRNTRHLAPGCRGQLAPLRIFKISVARSRLWNTSNPDGLAIPFTSNTAHALKGLIGFPCDLVVIVFSQ